MTNEQEQHLARIKADFVVEVDGKYREGQKEHGGNLYDLSMLKLLNNAIKEALDMYVYLDTLRENLVNEMNAKVPDRGEWER